jgi:transcription antitermination factor NusG
MRGMLVMAISERDFYEAKAGVQQNTIEINNLKTRVTDVEKKQEMLYEMNQNIAIIAQSLKNVEGDVSEVKESQKELSDKVLTIENAPAKETLDNMKKIKVAAISAVVTMVATGIAGAVIVALAK